MKKRLIDANALRKKAIWGKIRQGTVYETDAKVVTTGSIDTAPTVDAVEVVHGYWINTPPYRASNGNYNKGQECSVCHAFFVSPGNTPYSNHPYCCKCGAKMDGGATTDEKR
jgi:hypothetical protein